MISFVTTLCAYTDRLHRHSAQRMPMVLIDLLFDGAFVDDSLCDHRDPASLVVGKQNFVCFEEVGPSPRQRIYMTTRTCAPGARSLNIPPNLILVMAHRC